MPEEPRVVGCRALEPGATGRRSRRSVLLSLLGAIGAALWAVSWYIETESAAPRAHSRTLLSRSQTPERESAGSFSGTSSALPEVESSGRVEGKEHGRLGTIDGRVVDLAGSPIAGAAIRLDALGTNAARPAALSDETGRFDLPRSSGRLEVSREGYFPFVANSLEDFGDATGGELTIVLFAGGRLEGHVLTSDGSPVAGAEVLVGREPASPAHELSSDGAGRWQSPLLAPGEAHILIRHPLYRPVERQIALVEPLATTTCDVTLLQGAALSITVADGAGLSLADAELWLELEPPSGEPGGPSAVYLGRTGDRGELSTCREPGQSGRIRARLAGYREASASIQGERVAIVLAPAPLLSAQAIEARTGLPVTPSSVRLEYLAGSFQRAPHRGILYHSLADGRVRAGLPPLPGIYRLTITASGSLSGSSPEVHFDGRSSPAPVLVRLGHDRSLAGVVRRKSQPLAGAEVRVLLLSSPPFEHAADLEGDASPLPALLSTRSDAQGRFRLHGIPPGPFQVEVDEPRHAEYLSARLEMPLEIPGGELAIELQRGARLEGRVLGNDGAPLADVPVILTSSRIRPRRAWTDPAGRYGFERLPPASDYELSAPDAAGGAARIALGEAEDVAFDLVVPSVSRGTCDGVLLQDCKIGS
jgi:hypothetical protein